MDRQGSWAGTYEVTPDHFPFVGAMPGTSCWFNACGFSGHGVMQAPMTGLLVAEEIVDGRAHTVDIAPLRIERPQSRDRAQPTMIFWLARTDPIRSEWPLRSCTTASCFAADFVALTSETRSATSARSPGERPP